MEVRADSSAGSFSTAGHSSRASRSRSTGRASSSRSPQPENVSCGLNGNRVDLPDGSTFVVTVAQDHPGDLLSRPRAAIVVTGSELVRGERQDRNGPFLAAEAVRLGLEPASDRDRRRRRSETSRPRSARRSTADLCLVSGGLGPTHDDRTVELVARVAGRRSWSTRSSRSDRDVSRTIAERLRRPYGEFAPGVRKQATLPEGCALARPRRTAPGSCSTSAELRRRRAAGPAARAPAPVAAGARDRARAARARARTGREHHVLRFFGTPESAVAEALASAGGEGDGVEVTICAREFEIHVDLFVEPGAEERGRRGSRSRSAPRSARTSSARTSARSRRSSSTSAAPGPHARDRRVLHGGNGGGPPHGGSRCERRLPGSGRGVRQRGEGARSLDVPERSSPSTAPFRPRSPERWRRASASASEPTSASR